MQLQDDRAGRPDYNAEFERCMKKSKSKQKWKLIVALSVLVLAAGVAIFSATRANAEVERRVATVVRGPFRQTIHRNGRLRPLKEEHIICKIWGQITELAPQGSHVEAGQVVLRLDATMYEDQKQSHEAYIRSLEAQFKKEQLTAEKAVNQAKEDVASFELRVKLEQMRLLDLKKGPLPADAINARMTCENSQALCAATKDEVEALQSLLPKGCISLDSVRLKQLDLQEKTLKVDEAQIGQEKLNVLDDVKVAEQELKVHDTEKLRNSAVERLELLKQNLARDNENRAITLKRENDRLQKLNVNIEKTVYRAPAAGTVLHKPGRYYNYQPGRDVTDSAEVMSIPDNTHMKVALTVDEAHVSNVVVGLPAEVVPFGWTGQPFTGKVTRVAAKGRDEFEQYADETTSITGTANRLVFDVDVELDGSAPAFIPGLNAEVDIVLCTLDALQIPRCAIYRNAANEPMAVVMQRGATESRKLTVLGEDQFKAAVEGVKEGETVLLVPDGH